MNKKKIIIFVGVIILILVAIGFGIFKAKYNSNYLYTKDGKVINGKNDLINHLKLIQDSTERKKQVDFCLEQNLITKEEASIIY